VIIVFNFVSLLWS